MALAQAGMGLTKVVVLVGAGVAGSVVLRNGRLAEILGELQEILDKGTKGKSGGGGDGEADLNEALTSQVRRLAMEVRQLSSSRSITVLNGGSGHSGVSGLMVPAATVGALGYGYMWWKGISFSDLMYVTKRNMANAVSSMTKHLEQVQSSLAAAKRHLTQRIEKLDDKLDQQKALSGQIRDDVTDARLKLENIGFEIKNIKDLVWGLDGKIDSMEAKQEGPKVTTKRFGGQKFLQGLQLAIESGNYSKDTINTLINDSDSSDKINRSGSMKSVS
ncbi:hypothetical protein BAE44_0021533 [Dichanthelium oligosanthes]|uniref:DUF1664 domain-containing protein n=1 Tax=Dichanthelium oligosanthes TaxID=888268 RepID=A0A1E5UX30_9POAL|nr:hypothetical protein BAE44_0021533 [Dichanthelium oligosanthes]